MKSLFITGTDTDAGKTVVSKAIIEALVSQGVKAAGLKPIASGFDNVDGQLINADVEALTSASNVDLPNSCVNRYAFKAAIAPHIAASKTGQALSFTAIQNDVNCAHRKSDFVLVEGVGGWFVPLSGDKEVPTKNIQSLAQHLGMPIVLVVGLRLGGINHALLTANAIISSGLSLVGWVANHVDPNFDCVDENIATLEALLPAPKLFSMPYVNDDAVVDVAAIAQSQFIQSLCSK